MTNILDGIYYYFECLDGLLGERPLLPADVSQIIEGRREDLTEKELIAIAANYEATLYRQEYTAGDLTAENMLYDCYDL